MTVTEAASSTDSGQRKRDKKVLLSVALCTAALVAAVVMAVLWIVAAVQSDPSADQVARDRTAASEAAGDAAVALTTVSIDNLDQSLDAMHSATTGDLAGQFAPGPARDELSAALKETGVSMKTDLNSAVLTSFDDDKGTASALAFVVRTQALPEGQQRVLRQGIGMSLVKEDDGWKVSNFDTRFAGVGDANGENTGLEADGGGAPSGNGQPGGAQPEDAQPGAAVPGGGGSGGANGQPAAPDEQNPAGS
ncbi:MAG: hypothetical protein L0H59_08280 [Tomitella sp.]|nr:hypothetical protein [Tomitella sp.]